MIECLLTSASGTMERVEAPCPGCWVNVVAPTDDERAWLEGELGVLPEFVRSALDEEETSRVDFDEDERQIFVIVDYPVVDEDGTVRASLPLQYDTMPLTMVFLPEKSLFVTISIRENEVVADLRGGRVRGVDTRYRTRFLLQALLHISQLYLVYLRRIDRISSSTEARLHASVRNEELIQMLNLEKSLVYFSTSLKADEVTLNKIAQGRIIPLYEDDQDLLEDVLVEVHQAIEMANIYAGTLSGTMDAFASIISNNLNIVMKVLSVITIVMAIPNIVFGFYGMNVELPFDGVPLLDNWAFPLLLAAAGCLVAAWIFKRKGMWH
ncbi:MAG TPA: magnesium transporter CorA family protein [Candidatus Olsenella avicola]|uniref:magnesium transporter CorA family protein n=1 Tax=Olsenella sp. An285 TaxID=1965621 RepID=UPI000B36A1D9|nr:magnesium transporter CorA family protein [Olsenella sp. An285]OUO48633.1 magnesium transporter [Olsenella sp. An285]HIY51838.1 magnesium transporter CorA family protein [Candidatus Olsenella avicola]